MILIHGIPVKLINFTETDTDPFGNPICTETETIVDNVIVAPASADDVTDSINLFGKRAEYTLGIPKGDVHNWIDAKVEFFGQVWNTFGFPLEGIEDMVPLEWNKKVMVERYGKSDN